MSSSALPQYDVALSFAGEQRSYVARVAERLKQLGVEPFYDTEQQAMLWGKDLFTKLTDVYQNQALFTVMFTSKEYATKQWTNLERRAAQARAFPERVRANAISDPSSDDKFLHQAASAAVSFRCDRERLGRDYQATPSTGDPRGFERRRLGGHALQNRRTVREGAALHRAIQWHDEGLRSERHRLLRGATVDRRRAINSPRLGRGCEDHAHDRVRIRQTRRRGDISSSN